MRPFYENRIYRSDIPVNIFKTHNFNFLAHWHPDIELIYVLDGRIGVGINKEYRILNTGELAVCSSGDIHYYDSKDLQSTVIILIFRPELLGCHGGWPEQVRFISPFIDGKILESSSPNIREKFLNIFTELEREMANQAGYFEIFIKSRLLELSAIALRHFPIAPALPAQLDQRLPGIGKMHQALEYLETNYMHDITLEDAARAIRLSPFYLSRLFKKVTGMNFNTFLNSIRINQAEILIKTGDQPLVEIAFECGFNSIRTFNRAFKSQKGYPPSILRQNGMKTGNLEE